MRSFYKQYRDYIWCYGGAAFQLAVASYYLRHGGQAQALLLVFTVMSLVLLALLNVAANRFHWKWFKTFEQSSQE